MCNFTKKLLTMLSLRVEAFVKLGNKIQEALNKKEGEYEGLSKEQVNLLLQIKRSGMNNGWFTTEMVRNSFEGIISMLQKNEMHKWLKKYSEKVSNELKEVGIIMAGNIPLVGFHDFLCVLISGHKAIVKTSSDDELLLPAVADLLISIDVDFKDKIEILRAPRKDFDAVIATGSNNSARYFEQYFGEYPNIIRKSRTSVAVLTGDETSEQIKGLAKDLFTYYGLGCRNVSKFLIVGEFDHVSLIDELLKHDKPLKMNGKYQNNVDYNKSIYIINRVVYLDGGTFLLKEDEGLQSPISVTFYEKFDTLMDVENYISKNSDNIQCVVSPKIKGAVDFGDAQSPKVWDYADKVDTMEFLLAL